MSDGFESDLPGDRESTAPSTRMVSDYISDEERGFVYRALHVYSLAGLALVECCKRTGDGFEGAGSEAEDRKAKRKIAAIRKLGAAFGDEDKDMFLYELFEHAGFALGGQERAMMGLTLAEISAPGVAVAVFGALAHRDIRLARS